MSALDSSISIFKYLGMWRPESCFSGWKSHLYNIYLAFIVSIVFSLTFFELVTLAMSFDNVSNAASKCTTFFAIFTACGKILTIFINRARILELIKILTSDPLNGQDPGEKEALERIHRKIRFRTKLFIWVKTLGLFAMLTMTLVISIPQKVVWMNIWVPFHFATDTQYVIIMTLEIFGHYFTAGPAAMAYDTFVPGMMMQISAQLQLLQYRIYMRLKTLESHSPSVRQDSNENYTQVKMIAGWLQHHLLIYQYAAELNAIFVPLICLQYSSSVILLCVNVYAMVEVPVLSAKFIRSLMYNTMLFSQIFLLCLAGTEVMDDSIYFSRSIYNTHWYLLNQRSKKSMNIMMTRSLEPIKFTSIGIIETSLESFLRLVKISYSAYNCLQRFTPNE
uniref:Odorant receptor n=1 Tax=Meteorus pulchricornis TaxID=51522 RepID=A0A1S5VFM6_9HYME|nr:olfactory receptor 42 [Meteorus pulchricornis]